LQELAASHQRIGQAYLSRTKENGEQYSLDFELTITRGGGLDREYDEEYRRAIMLRNVAVVGERIIKVGQAHVKQKLKEAVRDATSSMPPEVLESEERLYSALEEVEEVDLWTKANQHMEVNRCC
jgi:hypothetical protein